MNKSKEKSITMRIKEGRKSKRITMFNYNNLDKILRDNNVGDIITYVTNNQMGLRIYKIIRDNNKKTIKEIGDILGLYEHPDHPDHIN